MYRVTCRSARGLGKLLRSIVSRHERVASVTRRLINGQLTYLNVPGASGTFASGINDRGQIVGFYTDSNYSAYAFVYDKGVYTTLDVPDAVNGAAAVGINNWGEVMGNYTDSSFNQHAFVYHNGVYTTLPTPSDAVSFDFYALNDRGQIIGTYYNGSNVIIFMLTR